MKKPSLQNIFTTNTQAPPLTKYEILSVAINERKMVKITWKETFTMKVVPEFMFPLHLFEYGGQEYLIWERPTDGNLDCGPIVAMGPVEMSSKYFVSTVHPDELDQFQNQWIYFEDGRDVDPSDKIKRIILKIHAPLLMVDFTPLQEIWTRFVVVGTAKNELIVSGNGAINQELFSRLLSLGLKVSFMAPSWAQKKFLDFMKKK
jgi:hypothetical protein